MRLNNFRIPSAVIGLTLMSSVAVLFSEPFTYAPGAKLVAQERVKKRNLELTTTDDFEANHLAKNREEALKKARARKDGGNLLHYMKRTDLTSLPNALTGKFHDELAKAEFKKPKPDIDPNNYWTGLKVRLWEYDKKKDKITDRTGELCLGLINFHVKKKNSNAEVVEIGIHHIHGVRD